MAINFRGRTMLNTLRKDIFCDFVKYRQSFFPSLVKNNY